MKVLVLNTGSTSVKYQLYEMDTETRLASGKVERVGTPEAHIVHLALDGTKLDEPCAAPDARAAITRILAVLMREGGRSRASKTSAASVTVWCTVASASCVPCSWTTRCVA